MFSHTKEQIISEGITTQGFPIDTESDKTPIHTTQTTSTTGTYVLVDDLTWDYKDNAELNLPNIS